MSSPPWPFVLPVHDTMLRSYDVRAALKASETATDVSKLASLAYLLPPYGSPAQSMEDTFQDQENETPSHSAAHIDTDLDSEAMTDIHIQVVESLTQLNLELLRHTKTIPSVASHPLDTTKDVDPFRLDDTFRLTTSFLQIAQSLQPRRHQGRGTADGVAVGSASYSFTQITQSASTGTIGDIISKPARLRFSVRERPFIRDEQHRFR
ncbi:hypothetical protein E0Z10_g3389 [Xylaria hypoxylon]|uniref:Uncharacterized protein n=1 Tax=Xylaria hypoxylon TaxID=37992 RepID=A0A4Z0YZE6_9PEZI|nr:hypothetical protein E0Z10_g3389 [Xylaria hypoxylon]